jgi:hypothetical protein
MVDSPQTTPAPDSEALATMADYAAMAFEPLSKEDLEAIKPPDNKEWGAHAKNLRVACLMLGKTKEEMKEVARRLGDQEGEEIFYSFDCTAKLLRGYADAVETADARLLCAFASLVEAADA